MARASFTPFARKKLAMGDTTVLANQAAGRVAELAASPVRRFSSSRWRAMRSADETSGMRSSRRFIATTISASTMKVSCQWFAYPRVSNASATNSDTSPPSLKPVHQPTTATAAPAAMAACSFAPTCSMRSASTVMSCEADAMAMTSPTATTSARLSAADSVLHPASISRITPCSTRIQAFRCPTRSASHGMRTRSISGAHIQLNAYTEKMAPAKPMVLRLMPSSLSHSVSELPISTHGKPEMAPSSRMRGMRGSR